MSSDPTVVCWELSTQHLPVWEDAELRQLVDDQPAEAPAYGLLDGDLLFEVPDAADTALVLRFPFLAACLVTAAAIGRGLLRFTLMGDRDETLPVHLLDQQLGEQEQRRLEVLHTAVSGITFGGIEVEFAELLHKAIREAREPGVLLLERTRCEEAPWHLTLTLDLADSGETLRNSDDMELVYVNQSFAVDLDTGVRYDPTMMVVWAANSRSPRPS